MVIYEFAPGTWSAETWSALGTWGAVAVAAVAALFAFRQIAEARRLREAQAQPFIVVTLEPFRDVPTLIALRVENVGQTLARDVKFAFDPPLASVMAARQESFDLNTSALMTGGIPSMPPGMRIERVFDNALEWGENQENVTVLAYDVTVTFSDYKGRSQEPLSYRVDLTPYTSGHYIEVRGVHHMAGTLKDIAKAAKSWSEGTRGLKVWTRDGDAKDQSDRDQANAWRERRAEAKKVQAEPDSQPGDGTQPPD